MTVCPACISLQKRYYYSCAAFRIVLFHLLCLPFFSPPWSLLLRMLTSGAPANPKAIILHHADTSRRPGRDTGYSSLLLRRQEMPGTNRVKCAGRPKPPFPDSRRLSPNPGNGSESQADRADEQKILTRYSMPNILCAIIRTSTRR